MLTAALLLLPAIAGGCAATRTAAGPQKSPQERQAASDSCAVFIPTHPPVVVPHAWNETRPSQKNQ